MNEQLNAAVEKQMQTSFARVIDQFTAVQKAMGDVQAVTAQIGDIKRLFSNVKTRGGWGETQVRAMLDDVLPAGCVRGQPQNPPREQRRGGVRRADADARRGAPAAADRREIPRRGLRTLARCVRSRRCRGRTGRASRPGTPHPRRGREDSGEIHPPADDGGVRDPRICPRTRCTPRSRASQV